MPRGFARRHPRLAYVTLAVVTIAAGLTVHLGEVPPNRAIRDVIGDALWAIMITWWVSALLPGAALRTRALVALLICFAVESSQLVRTPALDAVRATLPGHLLLGSGFDPRDLAAYAAGVAAACVMSWRLGGIPARAFRGPRVSP